MRNGAAPRGDIAPTLIFVNIRIAIARAKRQEFVEPGPDKPL